MYIAFIKNGLFILSLAGSLTEKIYLYFKHRYVRAHCLMFFFFLININLYLDQEVYDFIDPNTEDIAVSEQGDAHIGSSVSFLKVKKTLKQY